MLAKAQGIVDSVSVNIVSLGRMNGRSGPKSSAGILVARLRDS